MTPDQDHRAAETPPTHDVSGLRRRLLRGGLSSAPLLLTLTSRPVLATYCTCPSAALSGTASHKEEDKPKCWGYSHKKWKHSAKEEIDHRKKLWYSQHGGKDKSPGHGHDDDDDDISKYGPFTSWPIPLTDPFHNYFPQGSHGRYFKSGQQGWKPLSLFEVMDLPGHADPSEIGAHFVSVLLNIRTGLVDPRAMTEQSLKALWSEYAQKGYYKPHAGANPWYAADIVAYFERTGLSSY
ncbi:hypothetical protein [Pseudothauera rhizosphaerae]|uniref:hypothetical protein n=1 Tax=Pseudothauera rhizosphaerae TaxID=2565932 RepID=UPI001454D4D7|nr:hypothetical protein [Pseudothauera rhizosphaerae]